MGEKHAIPNTRALLRHGAHAMEPPIFFFLATIPNNGSPHQHDRWDSSNWASVASWQAIDQCAKSKSLQITNRNEFTFVLCGTRSMHSDALGCFLVSIVDTIRKATVVQALFPRAIHTHLVAYLLIVNIQT
jgi:hypothetical protein